MGKCEDPQWMGSDTYYPKGTVCYRDPSAGLFSHLLFLCVKFLLSASCPEFGTSGSAVVREARRYQAEFYPELEDVDINYVDPNYTE